MIAQFKFYLAAGILALACYGTWYVTSDHYEKKIVEIQLGMASAVQVQLLANQVEADAKAVLIQKGVEQHAKDQLVINRLHNDVSGLQVSGICSSPLPQTNQTSEGSNAASGVLPDRVDEEFARFQKRTGELIQRCDQLNVDVIQMNSSF
jgi:hypothetical protein